MIESRSDELFDAELASDRVNHVPTKVGLYVSATFPATQEPC